MSKPGPTPAIRLRGVRQNNLKNFDLDIPLRQLTVITGLSGSGKSSLAFDTLFAEGQRRYIETFSPYARQFFDRMDKPQVDRIEGIPPAIAIEQKNSVRTTRSTVGTMTEICDYLKVVWPLCSLLRCKGCDRPVQQEPPATVWTELSREGAPFYGEEVLITFELPLSESIPLAESIGFVSNQGYQRVLFEGSVVRLEELPTLLAGRTLSTLTVVQDRVKVIPASRSRVVEACEQAYHFGKGRLTVHAWHQGKSPALGKAHRFSSHFHCAACDLEYREPTPALFSFNHPSGACPACRGFGRIISIDFNLAIPDRTKTLAGGAVRPWQTGMSADCQTDLTKACRALKIPMDVPFEEMSEAHQQWVIQGEPDYGKDEEHQWPRAWYGVKGYFRWLESKAYKMHVRVLLSRYRSYSECPTCHGQRFQPETLLYRLDWPASLVLPNSLASKLAHPPVRLTLSDFYQLPVSTALQLVDSWLVSRNSGPRDPLRLALKEVRSRLFYLVQVGLGYLTLDRPTRTLSGGETERVNLTSCLGTRLVNTLFVLDEPSVGLHARDTARLIEILRELRDAGNTVVVVEHEASVMRAADRIVDLGPGQGERGGEIVCEGSLKELLASKRSLTAQYLNGTRTMDARAPRPVQVPSAKKALLNGRSSAGEVPGWIGIRGATAHNLVKLDVDIPLARFVCLTGVSGSGKTTLARDILLPSLELRLKDAARETTSTAQNEDADSPESSDDEVEKGGLGSARLEGWEKLDRVVLVDQSPLGKTPRSNPVVYVGAFEHIRTLFAETDLAKQRGVNASGFSFNSGQGQCERCRGAGFEKIEMQFLSDIFIRCPDCNGRRYRDHILEIKLSPPAHSLSVPKRRGTYPAAALAVTELREQAPTAGRNRLAAASSVEVEKGWSIADMLEATVDDSVSFLQRFIGNRHATRALRSLKLLQDVGLGYLRLGQPINTLSGGESQRLKLVSYLAETAAADLGDAGRDDASGNRAPRTLFLFDEPTTGLHFEDVRILLLVFQRLVDAGHSLVVIEHNLDVIRAADWVIDMGPEAGEGGGQVVVAGPPEVVMNCSRSYTGQALRGTPGSPKPGARRSEKVSK